MNSMLKTSLYNQEGKVIGEVELPENIFGVKIDNNLINQAIVAQLAGRRRVYAHTKTRGEVRGGGRKPWAQKGTGRARAGSSRMPHWRGGGVVFGPRPERTFAKKINRKMKRKAFIMALSGKVRDKEIVVIDEIKLSKPKTKEMINVLEKLPVKDSVLISLAKKDEMISRASRNIPAVKSCLINSLNVVDLLSYKYLLMSKESLEVIEKTFGDQ